MTARSGRSKKDQKRESFIQPLTAVIRNRGQLTPVELAVYLDLQTYDWGGEGTWVGQRTIADELGISERTVRDAVKKLHRVGAIECQQRPGLSNLAKVNRVWVPADPGKAYRGKRSEPTLPTPAESAGYSGNIRRAPRQNLPPTPAESAAETDTTSYTQEADATTDPVPAPAARNEPLSGITAKASQEQTQEEAAVSAAETAAPPPGGSSNGAAASGQSGLEALTKSLGNIDYNSPRRDLAEEALVIEVANRFNDIQTLIGEQKATGIRWQKFLTGFRMLLFSHKQGRSYNDVRLVLDYLKDNPQRAKEIVNKDKKRGVTNTYHLMFLFDRLYNEAVGRESEAEKRFSKRKIRIPDSGPSA